jgi:hypothetical protein
VPLPPRYKPNVPDEVKAEVQRRADELVEKHLNPEHVKPPPEDPTSNYLTGIRTKWHRSFFYLVADYASPGRDRLSPTYEVPFARLEYTRDGRFDMAYLRHTGQWWPVQREFTLDQAQKAIRDKGMFHPPG